ncbi:MAG: ABC transporter permease [Armatimonadetes bacterium]|nr:ABC transporter permease [Armatimonadota bacterium]MDW8122661.1 ABC transporter permease [Armatimonadota bacterium]
MKKGWASLWQAEWLAPLLATVLLSAALSAFVPPFRTWENISNIGFQSATILLVATGETLVIISAGIDLSVGSALALVGVVTALLLQKGWAISLSVLAGLGSGLLTGAVNGFLVVVGRIPPFIATLGMMGIARGLALVISGAVNISLPPESPFLELGTRRFLAIPVPFLIALVVALFCQMLLSLTRYGRHLYAVGGNREAARLSGVPVGWVTFLVFSLCGLITGLGGIVETARLSIGQPTGGALYELHAIAAAVIGGASLAGGRGSVLGTLLGGLLMAVIRNGSDLLNIPYEWQQVILGVLVVLAVLLDQLRRR